MRLTVIVAVYNEAKTILQAIKDVDKIRVADKEVFIIDNCSTDGTRELLKEHVEKNYRVIYNEKNIGGAGSVARGIKLAKGEYIYVHHTDLEYDPADANKMIEVAEEGGYDVVLGSRLLAKRDSIWGIIRRRPEFLATIVCTALVNRWYGRKFTDIIGSRLYRTASIRQVPISTLGNGFEFENISRMCKRGFKIAEVPVSYRPRSWQAGKKIRPYHLIDALFALFRVRYFE